MQKYFFRQVRFCLIFAIFTIFVIFLFANRMLPAYTNKLNFASAQTLSPDAIAVRVISNPAHYSALYWYKAQGFIGSPLSLTVDGYEAVRDGRTVYVNAANVSSSNFYTNIYLLSYNQEAEPETIDIFSQILSHWKFNINMPDMGECAISSLVCADNSDCAQDYVCSSQKCILTSPLTCLIDADCPSGLFCTSDKAQIRRDTKRLADLAEIEILLKAYQEQYNHYPILGSGSYLAHISISTWPSWQKVLAQELAQALPADPINSLGDCGFSQFHPLTCWDEQNKSFADPSPANGNFDLPANSYAYVYIAAPNGSGYDLYALTESPSLGGASASQTGQTTNHPPFIVSLNLNGAVGQPYTGYIQAHDPDVVDDDDDLVWSINTGGTNWTSWSAAPILVGTAVVGQKALQAGLAGLAGSYDLAVTITDPRGEFLNEIITINIINANLPVIQAVSDRTLTIGQNLSLTIQASEADSQYPLTFEFSGLPANFPSSLTAPANVGQHDYALAGLVIDQTTGHNVNLTVYDSYQGASSQAFTITIQNQPPNFTSTPLTTAEACVNYTYDAEAIDPDSGHIVNYSDPNSTLASLNLTLNAATGLISGQPQNTGNYPITIQAQDQYQGYTIAPYQAVSQQTYALTITDEAFSLNPISDNTVYVNPSGATIYGPLYYGPILYDSGVLSVTTGNHVIYGFSSINPALLPSFFLGIDPATGEMQGSPTDNSNDPNNYTITVQAANDCGATAIDNFVLTVLSNQWCGNNTVQTTQGEECDDGNADGTDDCDTSGDNPKTNGFCSWTFCGDQTIQNPNHYGVNEQCDDGADGDDTNQCLDDCTLTYCGDGVVQSPNGQGTGGPTNDGNEECDDGNSTNGDGCNNSCIIEFCGDSIIQSGLGEECDDGVNNGIVCSAPYSGNCVYCSDICKNVIITGPYCGDGIKNGGEECDGLDLGGQTCAGMGYDGGALVCLSDCTYDVSNCCSTNIATIQTCADNAHTTYFNGVFVSSAADWSSVQEYNVTVQPGKNVIAIAVTDWQASYGVSFTLNRASCNNMTTNDLAGWKCTASPGSGWTAINYDDSSWLGAVWGNPGTAGIRPGNYLAGIKQIWVDGVGCCTTIYCRYSFMY